MNAQKTHTVYKKIDRLDTQKKDKNILYQLESLIKTLYPDYRTTNPYDSYLKSYFEELNIEDVLLFKRLLKSITLLNHKERPQQHSRYISSYGDVLTAIELMSRHTINDTMLRSYVQLKEVFLDRPFTKLQASRVLRKSQTTLRRYMKVWHHLKLIEKTNVKQDFKATYRLIGYDLQYDYADYQPNQFIDLEYRT